jgi:energy-coupling factor transport system ATP-binding protein
MLEYTPRAIVLLDGKVIADTKASIVLTDTDLVSKANLKETSLYYLAEKAKIEDGTLFVQRFIDYEKGVRETNED